ncbi:ferritin [Flammeovirgaceae bacterium SG7u.111]|nr:ferritin [Flammeovirgaceae bacterium SG7u.132]WPO33476.1 ferritin [Flammeovirgaceae bacterium SG7u.111]
MKPIVTTKTSLLAEVEAKLNEQIKLEGVSSQYYLASASWCDINGYQNAADFLFKHADEERMHMMKIFRYVNASGGHALAPEITDIKSHYASLREVFEEVLSHEIKVTHSINDLVDFSFQEKDYATFQFLQWFVSEQREEEELARRILEIFDIIGEEGQGLWMIDQEIGKLGSGDEGVGSAAPDAAE